MRVWAGVIALCAGLLLSGCQADSGVQAGFEPKSAVDLLRNTTSFSYPPYHTPTAMRQDMDVVVVGEVSSVDVALTEDPDEQGGAVIIGLKPVEEWKRQGGKPGDTVYFWITRPTNLGKDVYQEAFPVGMKIVLFGQNAATSSDIRFATNVPDLVFAPVPQGVFIADQAGAFVNVWGDDEYTKSWRANSISELRRQAKPETVS